MFLSMFIVKETDKGMIVEFWGVLNNEETLICFSNYVSFLSCKKSINNIRHNALTANIEDRSLVNYPRIKCPKIIININDSNLYYFLLKARNGMQLTKSKSFTTKEECLRAIDYLKKHSVFYGTDSRSVIDDI